MWHKIADGEPEAYIRKALVHTHASWWRRRWRGGVPHGELLDRAASFDAYEGAEPEPSLALAVRVLPVRQRAEVVLRYFEHLGVEETAEVLGCAPGTVKGQASKALPALRALAPQPVGVPDEGMPRPARAPGPGRTGARAAGVPGARSAASGDARGEDAGRA
ncbi:sigma factor-like helix-turn-helix DNA-binding protein [Streptomyces sp. NPDC050085]|uniref:sigma factor-like helix-turn-helix DNA-binding protein n=1 Tax=Streptomyces sp. NPDC050085 TaxID=3365600 RepID=UPI00379CE591